MKKYLALILAFVMVLALFTGCGKDKEAPAEEPEEVEPPKLAKGYYKLLDEDEEVAGYLHSTGKKLTVWDPEGELLLEEAKFSYDEEAEEFLFGEDSGFALEFDEDGELTLFSVPKKSATGLDKGDYTPEEIEEEDLPVGGYEDMPEDVKSAQALNFGNSLTLIFKVSVPQPYDNPTLEITQQHYNGSQSYTDTATLVPVSFENNVYRFEYTGFTIAEIGCDVNFTFCGELEGVKYRTAEKTDCAARFAAAQISKMEDDKLVSLCVDLLNYGAAAQKYFNVNPEHPVNAELTPEQLALGASLPSVSDNSKIVPMSGTAAAAFTSKTCVFGKCVDLKYYFTFTDAPNLDTVSLRYSYSSTLNKEISGSVSGSSFEFNKDNSTYSAIITDILPMDMGQPVSAALYDGDTQISDTLVYSIEAYCYNRLNQSQDQALVDLVSAMVCYCESAKACFGK